MDVIAHIMENYMKLLLIMMKAKFFNAVFYEAAKFLFAYDSPLHYANYQISEEELKRLRSANQEWKRDLKVGDMVDAILDDPVAKINGWSQARIDQVNGDMLHLEFIHDVKTADKFIDRWSIEIAPFQTKTKDIFEWRHDIQVGSLVDGYDKSFWNKSTILDIKEETVGPNRTVKMATVAFRIYMDNGTKTDEQGKKYEGWSSKFDERISIYSPRI